MQPGTVSKVLTGSDEAAAGSLRCGRFDQFAAPVADRSVPNLEPWGQKSKSGGPLSRVDVAVCSLWQDGTFPASPPEASIRPGHRGAAAEKPLKTAGFVGSLTTARPQRIDRFSLTIPEVTGSLRDEVFLAITDWIRRTPSTVHHLEAGRWRPQFLTVLNRRLRRVTDHHNRTCHSGPGDVAISE